VTESEAIVALIALFEREGYARVEPPVLQPADVFIDLSGEDIRRRMFVTQDASGTELCLRPEYTIPVCLQHLAHRGAQPSGYSYGGSVFRMRPGESGEFLQAGIESIGRADVSAVDAEILSVALDGLAQIGGPAPVVKLGDMGLLHALIDALGIAPAPKRRVIRAIVSGQGLASLAEPDAPGQQEHAGLLAAIEGQAPQAAKAFVEDILSIAGIARVGGRSAGEIAERFLARAANRTGLADEARGVLERYLTISGDPDQAAGAVRVLVRDAGLNIDPALTTFEERTGFMAARGLDVGAFSFAATFARNIDYYTGFIFEVQDPRRSDGKPIVGGGRYDRLLEHLGAAAPIPAVGCSFWLDRILGRP
jgi:ATP phosphoribosyltransferase regulatory subunit